MKEKAFNITFEEYKKLLQPQIDNDDINRNHPCYDADDTFIAFLEVGTKSFAETHKDIVQNLI